MFYNCLPTHNCELLAHWEVCVCVYMWNKPDYSNVLNQGNSDLLPFTQNGCSQFSVPQIEYPLGCSNKTFIVMNTSCCKFSG